ncbi:putative integral membrane protein [Acanthocheilonema viteae]
MAAYSRNGFRWSLNPLLAIVAFCEFWLAISHLLFCSPLFPFLIPLIAAVFALITAFHALFLRFPNRTDFVLHCCSAALGFILLISSITETFCGVDGMLKEEEARDISGMYFFKSYFIYFGAVKRGISADGISMLQALCYGLTYRTSSYQKSCNDFLKPFHDSLLFKLNITFHTSSINFMTSFLLSGFALAHTATSTALAYYSANENGYLIRSYHGQLLVSIMMIPAALLHHSYCCTYFYLWPAVPVGLYTAFQCILTWKYQYRGKFVRLSNIFGSGFAMALAAVASFGMFCIFARYSMNHFPFQRHCYSPAFAYHYCYRVIDFRNPYTEWKREYIVAETSAIQILVNLWLFISAIFLFSFSLKSAFTVEIFPSYLHAQSFS